MFSPVTGVFQSYIAKRASATFPADPTSEKICRSNEFSLVFDSMIVFVFLYIFFHSYLNIRVCLFRYIYCSYAKMSKYRIGEFVEIKRKTLENLDVEI